MRYLLIFQLLFFYFLQLFWCEYNIQTTSGIVNGYIKNGVINWDDIPYAQPPIGDLRWKAPKKVREF